MKTQDLIQLWGSHPKLQHLFDHRKSFVENEKGSGIALLIAASFNFRAGKHLVVCEQKEDALYLFTDLSVLINPNKVHFLPSSFAKSIDKPEENVNQVKERTETLSKLDNPKFEGIIVCYHDAIYEKVASLKSVKKYEYDITKGEQIDLDFLVELLDSCNFEQEDFVYEPGYYAIRGGIIDVFSYAHEHPVRIVLDGNLVESIRFFDTETQFSISERQFIKLTPNIKDKSLFETEEPIFDHFLASETQVWMHNERTLIEYLNQFWTEKNKENSSLIVSSKELNDALKNYPTIFWGNCIQKNIESISFNQAIQPLFHKNFDLILSDFKQLIAKGMKVFIFSENPRQIDRITQIIEDTNQKIEIEPVYCGLAKGFIDFDLKIAFYTDHELFGRYFKYKDKKKYSKSTAITLKELQTLQPGDYVVHIDHGIGRFSGMHKMEMNGKVQEVVRIVYKNDDILIVNINSLHKISKYAGKEGNVPKIHKLGSGVWEKQKISTKNKVKDIARELIALYAKRKQEQGFAFSPDSYLQTELEASFIYEDTPDQAKTTEEVKADMESNSPMDRLVCGDVGFGKTEIAIRAAHKAVCDSKQVAILVPTTILAHQHYRTFKNRLAGFPVNVDFINRFKGKKEQQKTITKLSEGKIDILIGTHRIVSKDIKFKNLGLLIIDEEQKFGVAVKDKLKQMRVNIDTLTLTATPIPRTLHFSLMGARDLSIINTPPPNRQPVETALHTYNPELVKEAISYETNRGGQVFFVHHRVSDIHLIAAQIAAAANVTVCVAHGQMDGAELEKVMVQFMEGEYDVLVATSIIESGLDIPNANTIIINNAHMFGLSDLHQMRGRVGRSNIKAYCFLISPPLNKLTDEARQRLRTLEQNSELGAGFQVAMKDLDIRGAGNLLGGEQSGFISEIGFDMYHKILDEAMRELRNEEFSEVLDHEKSIASRDVIIDTDYDLIIPDYYIKNIPERLSLYTKLSNIETEVALTAFKDGLIDRFGILPRPIMDLLDTVRLKWVAKRLGLEKLLIRNGVMKMYYPADKAAYVYQSESFGKVINYIMLNPNKFSVKETANEVLFAAKGVDNVAEAIGLLGQIETYLAEKQMSVT